MASFSESVKTVLKLDLFALGIMHVSNRNISSMALTNNMLKTGVGKYYRWNHGDVFYHKTGSGSPIVLLHHLDPAFSSYEWNEIVDQLSSDHTVYSVDLPGCGRSFKDNTAYTNYFYVLFLTSFIKNIVKKKCTVIASGYSSSFAIMTASMNDSLIGKIIAVNPSSVKELMQTESKRSKTASTILSLPVVGTSVYNISESRDNIDLAFTEKYLYNPFRSQKRFVTAFYEGAHFNESNGKYLLASIKGKYMTVNLRKALVKAGDKLIIIYGDNADNARKIASGYQSINPSVKALAVSSTKFLPHMERPEAFMDVYKASRKL
ncbi:MAG: alpha/beta hydrolase [Lachnospiraceae bacterium]|nr:alpha/beta hydrolase [Lachnospiraceae bacterium]